MEREEERNERKRTNSASRQEEKKCPGDLTLLSSLHAYIDCPNVNQELQGQEGKEGVTSDSSFP